jgi:hypothetical protein
VRISFQVDYLSQRTRAKCRHLRAQCVDFLAGCQALLFRALAEGFLNPPVYLILGNGGTGVLPMHRFERPIKENYLAVNHIG